MIVDIYKFNATFKKGLMKGIVSEQTMTFSGEKEALDWMIRVNRNCADGNCDYMVTDLEKVGVKEIGV